MMQINRKRGQSRACYACYACGAVAGGILLKRTQQSKKCPKCGSERIVRMDSKAEMIRWGELWQRQKMGFIYDLQAQRRIPLLVGTKKIGTYVADFTYCVYSKGGEPEDTFVIEDVKAATRKGEPLDTAISAWKRKHVEAQTGTPVDVVIR